MRPGWRRLGRWGIVATGFLLLSSCGQSCGAGPSPLSGGTPVPTTAAGTPTGVSDVKWSISPLVATFDSSCYCTHYAVTIALPGLSGGFNDQWRLSWTIALTLVDAPGAADPETPGSAASIDEGCTNNGKGTPAPQLDVVELGPYSSTGHTFTWYHPDAGVAPPGDAAGVFHCDHSKQGPHGHQGVVKVVVQHGAQQCFASFDGTHSGTGTDPGQPGAPDCTRT
jgi:hypothetical protein